MLPRNPLGYWMNDLVPPDALQLQSIATSFCFYQITYLSDMLFHHLPQASAWRRSSASLAYRQPQLHPPNYLLCNLLDTNTMDVLSCLGIFNDSQFPLRTNRSAKAWSTRFSTAWLQPPSLMSSHHFTHRRLQSLLNSMCLAHTIVFHFLSWFPLLFWSPSSVSWTLTFRWLLQLKMIKFLPWQVITHLHTCIKHIS